MSRQGGEKGSGRSRKDSVSHHQAVNPSARLRNPSPEVPGNRSRRPGFDRDCEVAKATLPKHLVPAGGRCGHQMVGHPPGAGERRDHLQYALVRRFADHLQHRKQRRQSLAEWQRECKERQCLRGPPWTAIIQTRSLDPCIRMVPWQINCACVARVHTPARPVCGRHVVGTVVL